MFSSVLTKSGDVLVWFPYDRRMVRIIEDHDDAVGAQHRKVLATSNNVIPCSTWYLTRDPIKLPLLPSLPALLDTKETKLTKIAAFDNNLIGLTNQGHVLKFDCLSDEDTVTRGQWTYVSSNCHLAAVLTGRNVAAKFQRSRQCSAASSLFTTRR